MRVAVLYLFVSGCSCFGNGEQPDAGLDGGDGAVEPRDAGRDAQRDAARDAEADRPEPPPCEAGETRVDVQAVDRDVPLHDCGAGCFEVTRTDRVVVQYDVKEAMLAYFASDLAHRAGYIGWVDLAADLEWAFEIEPDEQIGEYGTSIAVEGDTIVYATYVVGPDLTTRAWGLNTRRQCKSLLREFVSTDASYGDIASDLDLDSGSLVWYDMRWGAGRQDVFAMNLETGEETRLTTAECCVGSTRIWGSTVAYVGWSPPPYAIWVVDLVTGNPHTIWDQGWEHANPAIHGSRVVFEHDHTFASLDRDIHLVDLDSGTDLTVVDTPAAQAYPDIYGDIVVWEDHRNEPPGEFDENIDIFGKDLSMGKEVQLTSLRGLENRPRVWDRTVFFIALIDRSVQVYSVRFPE